MSSNRNKQDIVTAKIGTAKVYGYRTEYFARACSRLMIETNYVILSCDF